MNFKKCIKGKVDSKVYEFNLLCREITSYMQKVYICFIFFIYVLSAITKANAIHPDSLLQQLNAHKNNDTIRAQILNKIARHYLKSEMYKESIDYSLQAIRVSKESDFPAGYIFGYFTIGENYSELNELRKAELYFIKGYDLALRYNKLKFAGYFCNYLANIKEQTGHYPSALKLYFKALEFAEKIKSKEDMAVCFNNIAIVYSDLKDFKKELTYNFKALNLRKEIGDLQEIGYSYNNIGVCYVSMSNYNMANLYYKMALEIKIKTNDSAGIASCWHNLAICEKNKGNLLKAEEYYLKALEFQEQANDLEDIILSNINLGILYGVQKKYDKSLIRLNKAMMLLDSVDILEYKGDVHYALYEVYEHKKNSAKALYHFTKYSQIKDSLTNADKLKEFTRIEMQNAFDREIELRNAEQDKKDAQQKLEKQRQTVFLYSAIGISIIISFFLLLMYRGYKHKQEANRIISQQKVEVEKQKHIIEEKQREVLDSINYAKRIQYTLLAHEDFLKENLPGHFTYFNPKDIVSGDFYWAASIGSANSRKFYLAVCDSTGHGVPGAFMSLLNIGFLSEAINEKHIEKPNEIFDYVRMKLTNTISKEGQKDGFDGILVCFETYTSFNGENASNKQMKITYAAANNAPVLIRKQSVTESVEMPIVELIEAPANRMPVGIGERKENFTLHTIEANKGDLLYLYTDGFADQFGGPNGKKFKYKQLNQLLLAIHTKPLNEQNTLLKNEFDNWKGDLEQVDDVCVIGIRI